MGIGALGSTTFGSWSCGSLSRGGEILAPDPRLDTASAPPDPRLDFLLRYGPIDREVTARPQLDFSGDQPSRAHEILWAKEAALKVRAPLPEVSERHAVVVVGGGLAGLTSAYLLRDLNPLVLEQAARFGGNSRGESWSGIDYALGAAYFMEQTPGTELYRLFDELGIHALCRKKKTEDPVLYRGKLFAQFWDGDTAPEERGQFLRLKKYFEDVFRSAHGLRYISLPPESAQDERDLRALDHRNFRAFLEATVGGPLHPHIETLLEHYCWSTLGCSMDEVSAAVAVPTYASEFGEVYVAPGGNAAVTERILERLLRSVDPGQLRPSSLVVDVKAVKNGAEVLYADANGGLRKVHARTVVMACPKFIARKMIDGLEPRRVRAIGRLRYASYLVANVLLDVPSPNDEYDIYLIGAGALQGRDVRANAAADRVTDVVNACYASGRTGRSVLSLYRALPYAGARGELLATDAYSRYRTEFRDQLEGEILPALGLQPASVRELRLTRWGHPIPVAAPGLFRDGEFARMHRPFRDKIFFVHQDNWAAPALETSVLEALRWAPRVRAALAPTAPAPKRRSSTK